MAHIKSRRMVGGTKTPRIPPAAPRASRMPPLVNIENIGGDSMGEQPEYVNPSIRLIYDEEPRGARVAAAAPGDLRSPAALSGLVVPEHFSPPRAFPHDTGPPYPQLHTSTRLPGRAHSNNPHLESPAGAAPFVPRSLFATSPAAKPGMPFRRLPASPAGVESFGQRRTLFHPSHPSGRSKKEEEEEEEKEEMKGGRRKRKMTKRERRRLQAFRSLFHCRKMVGGSTTPIIPPFPSPIAAPPPPQLAFSPPRALRAPTPAAAHAAPYSYKAIRAALGPETPAPGQNWEDLQNQRVTNILAQQAIPVFAGVPPSPAVPGPTFAPPLNPRQSRRLYAPLSPIVHMEGLRRGPLFEEDTTTPTEMEGGGRRRVTKKRGAKKCGTKRKALRRKLHHLRGGWPSWLRNPFSGCMDGKCDAAVAPAPPEEVIAQTQPQAEITLIRFNNQTYDIIKRLIELLQRSEVKLKNIQLTLLSLCNTINNIFIICVHNRNNQLFKGFFARSNNIVSNLRFILQLLGLYESGRAISTRVEQDVVDDDNVMLISQEMRDTLNATLFREVIIREEVMTLLSYIKISSENTKLNEIPEVIQRIIHILTIMGFGPPTTSSRPPLAALPVSNPREGWEEVFNGR